MTNKDPSLTIGNTSTARELVEVDGYLGGEMDEFGLHSLLPSQLGSDRYTEVYIDTESGNRYAILEEGYIHPDTEAPLYQFVILNGKELEKNSQHGQRELAAKRLDDAVIEKGVLKVGEPFMYGVANTKGVYNTSRVKKITCVNSYKRYHDLESITGGQSSNVRSEFWALAHLRAPHGDD